MLGCFNPNLGQWTNPNVGLKMQLKNVQLKVKVKVGSKFEIHFLTQHLSIFLPKFGFNQPSIVYSVHTHQYPCIYNSKMEVVFQRSGIFGWKPCSEWMCLSNSAFSGDKLHIHDQNKTSIALKLESWV